MSSTRDTNANAWCCGRVLVVVDGPTVTVTPVLRSGCGFTVTRQSTGIYLVTMSQALDPASRFIWSQEVSADDGWAGTKVRQVGSATEDTQFELAHYGSSEIGDPIQLGDGSVDFFVGKLR